MNDRTTDEREQIDWEEYRIEKYAADAITEGVDPELVGQWRLRRVNDTRT
ncbi:MAG TPA: hypothetical protein PKY77_10855 [Phycisphaerae bacterium]|nr:hypothetical protein [Phycisphaerae bacterium]HRY70080.1 hypothetical protein [Phycisphaerae bacterium]HSA27356.1 hypothetical protein [Phycisphaerae bacterium]